MSRPSAETMPSVAVRSRSNGLPIASTMSPTRALRESANCSGLTPFGIDFFGIDTTARSLDGSVPSTSPSIELPSRPNRTITRCELSTTWSFVTTVPFLSMRKPVPEPLPARIDTTAGLAAS
jgi:hypothetical protein